MAPHSGSFVPRRFLEGSKFIEISGELQCPGHFPGMPPGDQEQECRLITDSGPKIITKSCVHHGIDRQCPK